jgi:hypothetical protein
MRRARISTFSLVDGMRCIPSVSENLAFANHRPPRLCPSRLFGPQTAPGLLAEGEPSGRGRRCPRQPRTAEVSLVPVPHGPPLSARSYDECMAARARTPRERPCGPWTAARTADPGPREGIAELLVLPPEHADKIVPGGNGVLKKTIVAGGEVGTWAGPAPAGAPPAFPSRSTTLTDRGLPPKSPLSCRPRSTGIFSGAVGSGDPRGCRWRC